MSRETLGAMDTQIHGACTSSVCFSPYGQRWENFADARASTALSALPQEEMASPYSFILQEFEYVRFLPWTHFE